MVWERGRLARLRPNAGETSGATTTLLRLRSLKHARRLLNFRRISGDCVGGGAHLLLGFVPVAFLNPFAYAGQRLDAVTRVVTGRINLMAVPRPSREAFLTQQRPLRLEQRSIERSHISGPQLAARLEVALERFVVR